MLVLVLVWGISPAPHPVKAALKHHHGKQPVKALHPVVAIRTTCIYVLLSWRLQVCSLQLATAWRFAVELSSRWHVCMWQYVNYWTVPAALHQQLYGFECANDYETIIFTVFLCFPLGSPPQVPADRISYPQFIG